MEMFTLERDYLNKPVIATHKVKRIDGLMGKRTFTCAFDDSTTYPVYEDKSVIYFDENRLPGIKRKAIA